MNYILSQNSQTLLKVYIQPAASKNEIIGPYGDPPRLKVKIKAPPQDGEANAEIIAFIAKMLEISKSRIELLRGGISRKKDLLIDLPLEEVKTMLSKNMTV